MKELQGLIASSGICSGYVVIFNKELPPIHPRTIVDVSTEEKILLEAINTCKKEIITIKEKVRKGYGDEFAHIFRSQQTIVEDESILNEIVLSIQKEKLSSENSVEKVFRRYISMFSALSENDYNRQRLADVEDVYHRLISAILKKEHTSLASLPENTALIAKDLSPSDTVLIDKKNINCILTEKGGTTSHVAILAKTMQIPAAVRVQNILSKTHNKEYLLLDASQAVTAYITLSPNKPVVQRFDKKKALYENLQEKIYENRHLNPETTDHHSLILSGNVGAKEDIDNGLHYGMTSIGLFRSEFLFINKASLPDEQTQFEAYKYAAKHMQHMVVIRTLDIGGDKTLPALHIAPEANPFLGYRAIRICLEQKQMFRTQLRAILRASAFGNVKIMIPMISCVSEWRKTRQIINNIKKELENEKIPFNKDIEIGIMVEVPSTVLMVDTFAKEVDFFSIGTNDLTQYLFAADRLNENVESYYRHMHPAVFKAVKKVVDAAKKENIWVGVCGELAGVSMALPILIGLGVHELSMSAQLLPENIKLIRSVSFTDCQSLSSKVVHTTTEQETQEIMHHFMEGRT